VENLSLVKRPRSINLDDLDTSGEEVPHPALVAKAKWKLDMDDDNGEPQKKEVDVSRKKGMKREFFWNQAYTALIIEVNLSSHTPSFSRRRE